MIRLNKFLSDAGICSRREGDRLIASGRVTVNGARAVLGMQIREGDKVFLDKREVLPVAGRVYLAYNKPRGVVCTFDSREKHNLLSAFSYPERVTYAGRLDKESEGLLILTNDGDMIDQMMRARNCHEKEYVVRVDREINDDFLEKMRQGVYLRELGVKTRPCRVDKSGGSEFHIVLTQGLNRQIRRMTQALGFRVTELKRIRVMNIQLGDLAVGKFRELTGAELQILRRELKREKS